MTSGGIDEPEIDEPEYLTLNRANWDSRAAAHFGSPEYGVDLLVADPAHLSSVVAFDAPRLGDISGLRTVHLQCHIGTDTISLARLGARVSGLDLSAASVEHARRLARRVGADVRFVVADVYDAPTALGEGAFDLVYTGIGAIGWLPSIDTWADVVTRLLAPGGRLFIREGHPVLWAMDEPRDDGLLAVEYPYFETREPTVWSDAQTYVVTEESLPEQTTHEWNHSLGEIFTALLDRGMRITGFVEHNSVPYRPFGAEAMEAVPGVRGEFRLKDRPERLPLSYTLQAVLDPS